MSFNSSEKLNTPDFHKNREKIKQGGAINFAFVNRSIVNMGN